MAPQRRLRSSDRDRDASYGCPWMSFEGTQGSRGRCRQLGVVKLDYSSRRKWRQPEGLSYVGGRSRPTDDASLLEAGGASCL